MKISECKYDLSRNELDSILVEAFDSEKWVVNISSRDEFEEKIKCFTGAQNAIACVNGTAALQVSLLLGGVSAGDEVMADAAVVTGDGDGDAPAGED